ncbi:MAG: hypothetical protein Q4D35_03345 [Ruminococcus sp.]|nr:hypothetical protein [Ruminococcus sp.]
MNFFCIAFFISALQINLSLWVNYAVKFIGMLFFIGGIFEISGLNISFKKFLNPALILAGLSAVFAVMFLAFGINSVLLNTVSISGAVVGTAVTLFSLGFQKALIREISADEQIVNDLSLVKRFSKTWNKLAVITLANLAFDLVNRLVSVSVVADVSGLLMAISKIVMYIFALVILSSANKMRIDFNKTHGF